MSYFEALSDAVRNQDTTCKKEGRYPYIPYHPAAVESSVAFVKQLLGHISPRKKKLSFLDAGCGLADKVLIARRRGFDAYGIELCEKSLTVARILFDEKHIIQANLLTYDHYSKYDVIYLYLPLADPNLQKQLEARIVEQAKKNVIIISAGDHGFGGKLVHLGREKFFSRMKRKLSCESPGCRILVRPELVKQLTKDFAPCKTCKQ